MFSRPLPIHQMYRRLYVNKEKKIFCDTYIPADTSQEPFTGDDEMLSMLRRHYIELGYTQVSRNLYKD